MAFVLADRVQETSTTAGTGSFTLAGAASGFQTFSAGIGNANSTYYTIALQGGTEWEVGIGTYTSAGNTLSRDTVLSSSTGSKVSFSAGTKQVFCDYPAYEANKPIMESLNNIANNYTLTTGRNGLSVGPVTVASGANVTVPANQTWMVLSPSGANSTGGNLYLASYLGAF